jgi:A118 family predicted phage portal protein
MTAVTFWRVVAEDGYTYWRHLERHEMVNGISYILNGLYMGTADELGRQVDLNANTATAGLKPAVTLQLPKLMAAYVPNRRPNRRFRTISPQIGASDYSGQEGLMDALDEVYTSWMRDLRLAKARLLVPESFLKLDPATQQPVFDADQELFVALEVDPMTAGTVGITPQQFDIRHQEHSATAVDLMERIITSAGYSPQTFGLKADGAVQTATEVQARERGSFLTRQSKERYWTPALRHIAHVLLMVDRAVFSTAGVDDNLEPAVELADSVAEDLGKVAESVQKLSLAKAASIKTMVQMVHPDWHPDQIDAEVQAIMQEQGIAMPDPIQTGTA